jgi:Zn-dependent metalloprotease
MKGMIRMKGVSGFSVAMFAVMPQFLNLSGPSTFLKIQEASQAIRQDASVQHVLNDSRNTLSATQHVSSNGLETTKFQHYVDGIEVLGSMVLHHDGPAGRQIRNSVASFALDTHPSMSPETATLLAQSFAGDRPLRQAPVLKILPADEGDTARLIYWVELADAGRDAARDLLVDAHTGQVLANISHMETLAPVNVYSAQNQGLELVPSVSKDPKTGNPKLDSCDVIDLSSQNDRSLDAASCRKVLMGQASLGNGQCQVVESLDNGVSGDPIAIDPANCTLAVQDSAALDGADASAQNALANSELVLAYFRDHHGRDSFDNQGGRLISVVHAGVGFDNAAWLQDLNFMMYGDGDGKTFGDFTSAVDVAGHEMTHGTTAHTAQLLMLGESGAINEATSDFFGKMIENKGDWVVGRGLILDGSAPGIRDLQTPTNVPLNIDGMPNAHYPSKLSEALPLQQTCDDTNDRCWVHINSTIPGHGLYLITQEIGAASAEKLYYAVLTHYLTAKTTLKTWGSAVRSACPQVLDSGSCSRVSQTIAQLGL